jgi:crotonobetainyl-CoA:carnitine CoA-transferase CaiB-like acyl-CoA transferase
MVVEAPGADGRPATTIGVPVKLSRTPGSVRSASVDFGQDTEKILLELGYRPEQIADLAADGII